MLNDIPFFCMVCLFNTILVDDLYIAPNRCVVINDGPLDDSVLACNGALRKNSTPILTLVPKGKHQTVLLAAQAINL